MNKKKLVHNNRQSRIKNFFQKLKKSKKTCLNFQENFTILNSDFPVLKQNSKINSRNLISNGSTSINHNKTNTNKDLNLLKNKEITLRILLKKSNIKLTPLNLSQKILLLNNLQWKKYLKIKLKNFKKTDSNFSLLKHNKYKNLLIKLKS